MHKAQVVIFSIFVSRRPLVSASFASYFCSRSPYPYGCTFRYGALHQNIKRKFQLLRIQESELPYLQIHLQDLDCTMLLSDRQNRVENRLSCRELVHSTISQIATSKLFRFSVMSIDWVCMKEDSIRILSRHLSKMNLTLHMNRIPIEKKAKDNIDFFTLASL